MIPSASKTNSHGLTKGLLICGVAFAPLFCAVLIIQFFTRAGFDVRRTPISLLSLGDMGLMQVANFIVSGLLAMACAVGIRRAWVGGKGGTWGPLLVATHGFGLVLAGIFHPDPGYGFPPGAPAGAATTTSGHATLHNLAFLMVMVSLIAACFVFSRGFRSRGHHGWGTYSVVTGILAPVLIAAGIATHTILLITALPVVAFGWVSVIAARLWADLSEVPRQREIVSMNLRVEARPLQGGAVRRHPAGHVPRKLGGRRSLGGFSWRLSAVVPHLGVVLPTRRSSKSPISAKDRQ